MKFFRVLYDRLTSWTYPDPEKMSDGSTIPPPSSFVRFVFEADTYTHSINEVMKQFKVVDIASHGPDRLEELSSCRVLEIAHYRRASGLGLHEFTLHKVGHGPDIRYIRMERSRGDLKDVKVSKETEIISFHEFLDNSYLLAGYQAFSKDKYTVLAKEAELTRGAHLVQSFIPPPAMNLSILDCVILANTISEAAKDYTVLHHMCMWWAAVYFITIHRFSEAAMGHEITCVHGTAYAKRGMFHQLRLVNADGNLCLQSPNIITSFVHEIRFALGGGDANAADVDRVETLVNEDATLEGASHLSPSGILSQFEEDRIRIRNEIKHDVEVRDEERRQKAQMEVDLGEQDIQLKEAAIQLQEAKAQRQKDAACIQEAEAQRQEAEAQRQEAEARIMALEKQLALRSE